MNKIKFWNADGKYIRIPITQSKQNLLGMVSIKQRKMSRKEAINFATLAGYSQIKPTNADAVETKT